MASSSSSSSSSFAAIRDLPQPLHHLFHLPLLSTTVENLPTSRHFLAAAIASAVASGTFNPLDCLRVRWQTQVIVYPVDTTPSILTNQKSIIAFGRHIIEQEGIWQGLWKPGLGVNMVGMGLASGLRFGYYETMRNSFDGTKQTWHMLVAGLISGGSAYWITTPFHLMKTRIQAAAAAKHRNNPNSTQSVWQGVYRIVARTGNVSSLYKGSGPLALRGALFTSGQMLGTFVSWFVRHTGEFESFSLF
jgi:Mitochondrial carrier protein